MCCTGSCLVQFSTANSNKETLQCAPAGTPAALVLNLGTVRHRTLGILQTLQEIKLFFSARNRPMIPWSSFSYRSLLGSGRRKRRRITGFSGVTRYDLWTDVTGCLSGNLQWPDLSLFCVHNWLLTVLHYFVCGLTDNFTRLRVQESAWIWRI